MPCFNYDPSTFISTANAYNSQSHQILHGYESSMSTLKSKQTAELNNFITTSTEKLTNISNLALSKFSADEMKNLENNHLRLLESTKTETVSKAVETIKEIKKDKSIRQQEVNRKIREIRHANAKIVSEKQQVLMQKHDKDLKNIKERLKEISSLSTRSL